MRHAVSALILVLVSCAAASAAQQPLRVAVRLGEPGAFYDPQGHLVGAAVELWELVGGATGLSYEYVVLSHDGPGPVLDAVSTGRADVAVGALSVTAEREQRVDFLQPFLVSGLAIAAPARAAPWYQGAANFCSRNLGAIVVSVFALVCVAIVTGSIENWSALESLYWAITTMATVGYGDFAPKTKGGRVVAMLWMFTGIGVFGFVIAQATASLTASELRPAEVKVSELHTLRVGTVAGSTGEAFLVSRKIVPSYYNSADELVDALNSRAINAAVYDEILLRYWIEKSAYPLRIATTGLTHEIYAFAVTSRSLYREELNQALLRVLQRGGWDAIMRRYKINEEAS